MKNLKINWKVVVSFLLIGFVIAFIFQIRKPDVKVKIKTELIKGAEKVSYAKGKEVESKKLKVESGKKKAKINEYGVANAELHFDDSAKVKIEAKIEGDSVELFFDMAYFEKSFLRVDTIKTYQLDTLKIETERTVTEGVPFWEKWWFGGIIGGVLVLLIVIASGK